MLKKLSAALRQKENRMKQGILFLLILLAAACGHRNETYITENIGQPISPVVSVNPVYIGCFTDNSNRVLPAWLINSGATVESCIAAAKASGYAYAGVEYSGQCFSGNILTSGPATNCNMPCSSNPSEICGGNWAMSVYWTGL
jgi:WSC domain